MLNLYLISIITLFSHVFALESSSAKPSLQLIVFEGSDWCPNCIRLEESILSDSLFINYLNEMDITLLKIDFPQRKKLSFDEKTQNNMIAEKYNFDGNFPTIYLSRVDPFLYHKLWYKNQNTSEMIASIDVHLLNLSK